MTLRNLPLKMQKQSPKKRETALFLNPWIRRKSSRPILLTPFPFRRFCLEQRQMMGMMMKTFAIPSLERLRMLMMKAI